MPEALRSVLRNSFKEKLAAGQVVSSMGVRVFGSIEIVHVAKSCGFDALYIDLLHSSLSLETTSQLSIAALGVGIMPLVRVPGYGPEYVSRVLDGGALGVTAPGVRSPADVEKVVAGCKFAPLGERSVVGGLPHLQYRNWPQAEVMDVMNETTMVFVTIENLAALDCIEDIAAVKGLDVLGVGTNDLCAELGIPGQHGHELVRQAYARIIAASRKHGKYVGVGGISDRKIIADYVALGARVVHTGPDIGILMAGGNERAQFVRSLRV